MILALVWLLLTGAAGWELHRHHMFSSALPALAVLAWWGAACVGAGLLARAARSTTARRMAQYNADREALRKEVLAEVKRQQESQGTQGAH
jgi:hypothetical protein